MTAHVDAFEMQERSQKAFKLGQGTDIFHELEKQLLMKP